MARRTFTRGMGDWLPLIGLLGAALAVHGFMRFAWPWVRRRMVGSREVWALRHGFVPQTSTELGQHIDACGRPGIFGIYPDGRVESGVRTSRVALVDYSFVIIKHGRHGGSRTERRQVTIAMGSIGQPVPRIRVQPRTVAGRIAELMFQPKVRTGDLAFDRGWQLAPRLDSAQLLRTTARTASAALRDALVVDEPAVLQLLTAGVRTAIAKSPKYTFEFDGEHLLVFQQWRLLPNHALAQLVDAWANVAAALRAADA